MRRQRETAVLLMTDMHIGKQTSSYSVRIAQKRIASVARKVRAIRERLGAGYELDLTVLLLGDNIDGSGIYPGQAHHTHGDMIEQITTAARTIADALTIMADAFPTVRVTGVPGNHGRVGKHAMEGSNWDLAVYSLLPQFIRARNVSLEFPVSPSFAGEDGLLEFISAPRRLGDRIHHMNIRGHGVLVMHGHGVKSYTGNPFAALHQRAMRWSTSSLPEFTTLVAGHWHTLGMHTQNNSTVMLSGTAVSGDLWALEQLGLESVNQWWFYGVSRKHQRTWQFALDID